MFVFTYLKGIVREQSWRREGGKQGEKIEEKEREKERLFSDY